jgi:selT/selW/selH-like putative selenoprotein
MSITKERFAQGLTYTAYKAQMTRNRERLEANEQTLALAGDDLAFFARLAQPVNVLVLAEDWCGDVLNNLPVLARLAEAGDKLHVRIFLRDQNLDIMDQYLKEGQFRSIPVFVFFDQNFNELGYWIERPARISEWVGAMRSELFATDPLLSKFPPNTSPGELPEDARNRYMQANAAFRAEHRVFADQEVMRELRALIEHGISQLAPAANATVSKTIALIDTSTGAPLASKTDRVKVSITYCAECGYEPQTLELAGALMKNFLHELSVIELIPWHDGAFDVVVGGDLVHSMYRDGGFPEHATIIQAVRDRLA